MRNNPEERSSHLLRGRSLKSRTVLLLFTATWFGHFDDLQGDMRHILDGSVDLTLLTTNNMLSVL
jgi:hypothetical protein